MEWGTVKLLDSEIYRLRVKEKKTLTEIAQCLGVSISSVHRRTEAMGLPSRIVRNPGLESLKTMEKSELEDMYSHLTSFEIADVVGCDVSTVNRVLKSKGIERRRSAGWLNLRLRLQMTVSHKMFAYKLVEAGVDLRWDWIDYPVKVGNDALFFIDIAIPDIKLGIEIDGSSHFDENSEVVIDEDRDFLLESCGWQMIHLNHHKAYLNAEATAKEISKVIESAGSTAILTRVPGSLRSVK